MKENVSLDKVLGCDPMQTYLGVGYRKDVCRFSDIDYSADGFTANLHFDRSALLEAQGFHLSAMNVQWLVPYLCRQFADAEWSREGKRISSFQPLYATQEYIHYVKSHQGISMSISLVEKKVDEMNFKYEFCTPEFKPAFHGTMAFRVAEHPDIVSELPKQLPFPLGPISCHDTYSLNDVYLDRDKLSIEATISTTARVAPPKLPLSPVQIHGAMSQLLRGLFCSLFSLGRHDVIDAMARKIVQNYTPQQSEGERGDHTIIVQAEQQTLREKNGIMVAYVTCTYQTCPYQASGGYSTGTLDVVCPLPELKEEQLRLIEKRFAGGEEA